MSALLRWWAGLAWRWLDRVDFPLLAGLLAIMAASLLVQASAAGVETQVCHNSFVVSAT